MANTTKGPSTELTTLCRQQFATLYGYSAEDLFFSPGRINIIGEHIDYNGGLVFPCAIDLGTAAAVARRTDHKLRLYSHNFAELGPQEFHIAEEDLIYRKSQSWCNYPLGMLKVLQREGMKLACGLDIVVFGNLPTGGSGLSSSASLEILMGCILLHYSGLELSRRQLAVLAQRAENEFCGIRCGIMDQFIIAVGQARKACLLDCASLQYEHVALELSGHAFFIANTRLPRKLQESKYNERRAECEAALAVLQKDLAFQAKTDLCSITEEELPAALKVLQWGKQQVTLERRVHHAVTENIRTRKAAAAMQEQDWKALGRLLSASHASLQNDYEVSGQHLDCLVALLEQEEMVLGARMTGAGFGGCAVALLRLSGNDDQDKKQLQTMQQRVAECYQKQFGWTPEFYLSEAAAGAGKL